MSHALAIFVTLFLAELGDKTQLATLLFASDRQTSPWVVFAAESGALVASTAIAVLLGTLAKRTLSMIPLKLIAGIGFIAIGAWTLWDYARAYATGRGVTYTARALGPPVCRVHSARG